jgi:hypothetical protein
MKTMHVNYVYSKISVAVSAEHFKCETVLASDSRLLLFKYDRLYGMELKY